MKYQVMRDLTPEEYSELKESIMQNGVIVPIVLDEDGNIIDGHHRKKICDELHISYPTEVKAGLSEEKKIALARELNEARRQLSADEKRREIERRLRETPELSDRQIAKQVDVSPTTVGTARKILEHTGEVSKLNTSIGADGKEYPRQAERKHIEPPPAVEEPPAHVDEADEYDENQIDIEETIEEFEDEPDEEEYEDAPRAKVFSLVDKQRQEAESEYEKYIDGDNKFKELDKVINQVKKLKFSDEDIDAVADWHNSIVIRDLRPLDETLGDINEAIKILRDIGIKLLQTKGKNKNAKTR